MGVPLLVGLPPLVCATPRGPAPPSFIYGRGAPPLDTQLIIDQSRVRRPPPSFRATVIFPECYGEALPEYFHRHRHHAIVLTELIYYLDV